MRSRNWLSRRRPVTVPLWRWGACVEEDAGALQPCSPGRQARRGDLLSAKRPGRPTIKGCDTNNDTNATLTEQVPSYVIEEMVGTRRLELLTSTVSKSTYEAIQQLTGYPGLPKSVVIRHRQHQERNQCGTRSDATVRFGFLRVA